MYPSCARLGHLYRPRYRIVVVDGLGAVVALAQAHAAAPTHIDSAVQVHDAQPASAGASAAAASTKLARICRPTRDDFSG